MMKKQNIICTNVTASQLPISLVNEIDINLIYLLWECNFDIHAKSLLLKHIVMGSSDGPSVILIYGWIYSRLRYGQVRRYDGFRPVKVRYSVVYNPGKTVSFHGTVTYLHAGNYYETTADLYGYTTAVRRWWRKCIIEVKSVVIHSYVKKWCHPQSWESLSGYIRSVIIVEPRPSAALEHP